MNLSNYTKVRLTDSKGLNGETAWAYGMRKNQYNYDSYNLRLILDNNTSYFSAGTELILEKDGYTVDMKATQELANAKALIAQYHDSMKAIETPTSKLSAKLVKKGNLSKFIGKKILVSAGEIEFISLQENDHSVWLEGKNLLTGEIKKYSDFVWLAKKSGYSEQDIELYFG